MDSDAVSFESVVRGRYLTYLVVMATLFCSLEFSSMLLLLLLVGFELYKIYSVYLYCLYSILCNSFELVVKTCENAVKIVKKYFKKHGQKQCALYIVQNRSEPF